MEYKVYLFYDNGNSNSKIIQAYKNVAQAKAEAEKLYKKGKRNIVITPVDSDISIRKMMYKVIYKLNGKTRMTTCIGYSDNSTRSYQHINIMMKELGVCSYKVIPIRYDSFVNAFDAIKTHSNQSLLHNLPKEEYKVASLSNLFSPTM